MPRSGALLPFPAQDQPAGDDVRHLEGDHRAPGDLGCAAPLKNQREASGNLT